MAKVFEYCTKWFFHSQLRKPCLLIVNGVASMVQWFGVCAERKRERERTVESADIHLRQKHPLQQVIGNDNLCFRAKQSL